MQILLASAKIMNAATSVDIPMLSLSFRNKPDCLPWNFPHGTQIVSWKELKCSQAIALENQQRYQSFWNEEELLPSSFYRQVKAYKYLQADNFSQDDFALHKIISSSPLSYMVCCVLWI